MYLTHVWLTPIMKQRAIQQPPALTYEHLWGGYVIHRNGYLCLLQCNGKGIKWKHLAALYKCDSGAVRDAPGLSLVPKLKWEHIHLMSFSKMRVDLAIYRGVS